LTNTAFDRAVIVARYTVLFTRAMELVANLAKAQSENRLEERPTHYTKPKLLIVDELGYLLLEPDAAQLFFQIVFRRYERGAMLVTSNRAVGEWAPSSATRWWPPRSSIGCFTTATSSRSGQQLPAPRKASQQQLYQPNGGPVLHVAPGPDPNVAGHKYFAARAELAWVKTPE